MKGSDFWELLFLQNMGETLWKWISGIAAVVFIGVLLGLNADGIINIPRFLWDNVLVGTLFRFLGFLWWLLWPFLAGAGLIALVVGAIALLIWLFV